MGVPKFFRYISERYPCLSELIRENQIPNFDNLYLDMNGIIHSCSHPNDSDIYFRITEEQIFKDIFHYIDTLFRMIQPNKLFFMAIDGVAPRAKMNQQRGRRFRSAKEAEMLELKAKNKGETLPTEERFDSNCITPGTPFMARLQEGLKYFVKMKITTNPLWQNCRVILSGHETPGEGEHKIMEYIRYLKAQENYDRNTRHCLYGLDADLIMLGLCTHELYFSLLREEVKFGRQTKRAPSVNETRFFLLHLGLLREYLELEFSDVKDKLLFDYNIERIIDDWIFMGFLVGNDFIPHLPNLHIASNALPLLYASYMEVLPTLDGYINECGKLNLGRLEIFIKRLAIVDKELFTQLSADFKYLDSKHEMIAFNFDVDDKLTGEIVKKAKDLGLQEFIQQDQFSDDMDDEEAIIEQEFVTHKRNYYINKMHYPEMTPEVLIEQTECYVRALQWTLSYYYHGVQSWSWYYPYHYAPYISDVKNFRNFKIDFELGKPFLPFQQLLAVLPAASKNHLPLPYRRLMTDVQSRVIDYYPVDFETDLNGKKQDWEAVVLIPFINETLLLDAMKPCNKELLPEERGRNIHGPMLQYDYTESSQGKLCGEFGFPDIGRVMCTEKTVTRDDIFIPEEKLILELTTPTDLKYHLGFPTMKHLLYSSSISRSRVKVFEQSSRNDNMVINIIIYDEYKDVNLIAEDLLDKEIFVSWPHLRIAKVTKISTENTIWTVDETTDNNPKKFESHAKSIVEHHMGRLGIDVGEITVIVHVNALIGQHYVFEDKGTMKLKKTWDNVELVYPIQAIVKHIDYFKKIDESDKQVEEIFSPGTCVFMLSTPYYGSKGEVIDPTPVKTCGRIKVCLTVYPDPDYTIVKNIHQTSKLKYVNSYNAASTIGISTNILSRITGSILVVAGARRSISSSDTPKSNIGLQLKFTKNNEEVVGFTRKHAGSWYYSPSAIELVKTFGENFPELFRALGNSDYSNDIFFEFELFPKNFEENNIDKIIKWLKTQPHYSAERRTCGTEIVEKETVLEIIQAIDDLRNTHVKNVKLQVKPHLLYKPGLQITEKVPDENATYRMFDRVVVARDLHSIPIGYKGTIIGIHQIRDPNPVRQENLKSFDVCFDVIFDQEFEEGTTIYGIADKRIYRVPKNALINITFGSDKSSWTGKPITNPPEINAWAKPLQFNQEQNAINKRLVNIDNHDKLSKRQIQIQQRKEEYYLKKATQESTRKVETWFKNSMNDTENDQKETSARKNDTENDQKATGYKEGILKDFQEFHKNNRQMKNEQEQIKIFGAKNLNENKNNNINSNINNNNKNNDVRKQQTKILDHKTIALRQMLGVSSNKVNPEETLKNNVSPTKPIINQEQHTVLSVDDFFNMHKNSPNKPPVINLPQPPPNWRKEAFIDVSKLENRSSQETENKEIIIPPTKKTGCPPGQPTVIINSNIMAGSAFEHQSQTPQSVQQQTSIMYHPQPKLSFVRLEFSPGFVSKTENEYKPNIQEQIVRPNGPQNLSNNSMNPAGHGAFIPLQAVKSLNKSKPVQQNSNPQPPSRFIQRNAEQRQEVQQKQTESIEGFASFMKDDNAPAQNSADDSAPIIVRKSIPKPFRPSRIAAKFFSDAVAD